ncbi:hypothetical protein DFJ73DRAFT_620263 [Zopfochytrium polystomum]|nr:hypothetical protein DFJ73DRAFT_620263 [Zopfochytrium polystomum]
MGKCCRACGGTDHQRQSSKKCRANPHNTTKVYDVTDFLDAHPGGKRILAQHLGKDATKQFALFHNLDSVSAKYDNVYLLYFLCSPGFTLDSLFSPNPTRQV